MANFDEFIASLEVEFGPQGKGKKFEVFCKWFLENDPECIEEARSSGSVFLTKADSFAFSREL